ncbi:MAG: hypothetical protein KGI57_10190 [Hyphomicrobiales bacterium]|nr:hypothetical protein [Hyphomicrobiales bacterium]
MRLHLALAAGLAALALAGCDASAPPASATAAPGTSGNPYTPSGFALAKGAGCTAVVARWREVQANDVHIGYLTAAQGKQFGAETDAADAACKAGQDAKARGMVAASRARHGYPADSGG